MPVSENDVTSRHLTFVPPARSRTVQPPRSPPSLSAWKPKFTLEPIWPPPVAWPIREIGKTDVPEDRNAWLRTSLGVTVSGGNTDDSMSWLISSPASPASPNMPLPVSIVAS